MGDCVGEIGHLYDGSHVISIASNGGGAKLGCGGCEKVAGKEKPAMYGEVILAWSFFLVYRPKNDQAKMTSPYLASHMACEAIRHGSSGTEMGNVIHTT